MRNVFLVLVVVIFSACRTTRYVNVPEYHIRYVSIRDTLHKTDSIYIHDSVNIFRIGDTTYVNRIKYRDRYHYLYKVKIDTLTKTDSICKPLYIDKPLTKWQSIKIMLGEVAFSILSVFVLMIVIKLVMYIKR